MPSASSFTNKVRANTEGRNTKVEYKGGILNQNNLSPLMCTNYTRNGVFQPPWWVTTQYKEICRCNK